VQLQSGQVPLKSVSVWLLQRFICHHAFRMGLQEPRMSSVLLWFPLVSSPKGIEAVEEVRVPNCLACSPWIVRKMPVPISEMF